MATLATSISPQVLRQQALAAQLRGEPFDLDARRAGIEQQIAALDAPQDMAPLQAEGRRLGERSVGDLAMAMAASRAGPEYEGIQQHALKQAMAGRQGVAYTGGRVNEQGDVLADPGYAVEGQRRTYEGQLAGVDRLQSARDARADAAAAAKARQDADIADRQFRAGQTAADRAERAAERKVDRAERDELRVQNDVTKRTDRVRAEYNTRQAKIQQGVGFSEEVLNGLSDPGIARNALAQVAMVMQFGKMLDPDSVVREAEQQMIAGARGFADTLQQMIPQLKTGALLTPTQLKQMRGVAQQYQAGNRTRMADLDAYYTDLATRNKLPAEDIVYTRRSAATPAATPAAAPGAAPAAPGAAPATPGKRLKFNPATGALE